MVVNGEQFLIYGESGHSMRTFLEVPLAGTSLNDELIAFSKAMKKARVTVEWFRIEIMLDRRFVD